jgi:hypothetical protein
MRDVGCEEVGEDVGGGTGVTAAVPNGGVGKPVPSYPTDSQHLGPTGRLRTP